MKRETEAQHHQKISLSDDNRPLTSPIYQSAKFTFPRFEDIEDLFAGRREGYFYTRKGNPTVRELEVTLAQMQGQDDGFAFSSGVAAISHSLIALLEKGDHVVLFWQSYLPTRVITRDILGKFGVEHSLCSVLDLDALEATLKAKPTKLVILEATTNPMLFVPELDKIVELAHKYGAQVVLDATFTGVHQLGDSGVDLFIHSLTKYVSGHGDVIAGAVVGSKAMIQKIRNVATELGGVLDPQQAFLCLRGIKTYFVRRERQCQNSLAIAQSLQKNPKISKVYHPGLDCHPEYLNATRLLEDSGTLVSFDLSNKIKLANFLNALKIIEIAGSLGSTETIIAPVMAFYGHDLSGEAKKLGRMTHQSVRLSVGLEDAQDIVSDIAQALDQ